MEGTSIANAKRSSLQSDLESAANLLNQCFGFADQIAVRLDGADIEVAQNPSSPGPHSIIEKVAVHCGLLSVLRARLESLASRVV
jgi:hypothetical protein